jgi:hypothetical protein
MKGTYERLDLGCFLLELEFITPIEVQLERQWKTRPPSGNIWPKGY